MLMRSSGPGSGEGGGGGGWVRWVVDIRGRGVMQKGECPDFRFPEVGISAGTKSEYIPFPSGPVQRVFKPSSPVWFNEKIELNCTFKGWPRPTVVWINPDGNKIKNGSDGFEIYEELIGDDKLSSVLKNPHMQEKQYGEYWCTAENSIDGWSSKLSKVTELIYECK